jgi:hypothetical protein
VERAQLPINLQEINIMVTICPKEIIMVKKAFIVGSLYLPTNMVTKSAEAEWRHMVKGMTPEMRRRTTTNAFYKADHAWGWNVVNGEEKYRERRIKLYSLIQGGFIALRAVAEDFKCEPDDAEGLDAMAAARKSAEQITRAINSQQRAPWRKLCVRLERLAGDNHLLGFLRSAQAAIAFHPDGYIEVERQLVGRERYSLPVIRGAGSTSDPSFDQRRVEIDEDQTPRDPATGRPYDLD